jgi:Protein kinase domain
MGVVFRATQLALQRPVALKAIAPELAADEDYRERFKRESHLAASIEHPNVIPVYEAGELDGTLYLIMRWVEGTDLKTLLTDCGPVSPARAITLLRPVASALTAAHRRGLVHRDIKPANVMIARGDEENEDHIYLTDFGIARRTDGESLTRTGVFVGTIDYSAPERIEGRRGEAPSDIYSLGCMLFETLTGHVPFDRPTNISKIFAHIHDSIPSARDEVDAVPARLDAIIAEAMAKRPEDRFGSAGELTVVLSQALQELETAEPPAAAIALTPSATKRATAATEPAAAATQLTPPVTEPTAPSQPQTTRLADGPRAAPRRRRFPILWVASIASLAAVGVLVAALSGTGGHSGTTGATSTPSAAAVTKIQGSGLTEGRTVRLASRPGSISIGPHNVWISLPELGEIVRFNPITGLRRSIAAAGGPTAIAVGFRAVWVAEPASLSLAQFNGDSGAQVAVARLAGSPTAVALDQNDSSAWVADLSGAIRHVALGGAVIGTPAHIDPAATSIDLGEGWLWAVNGADNGLVRVSLGTDGSSTAFAAGPHPVAVAFDQGVWTGHANGDVTRFDPRPGHLRVNARVTIAPELDAIAATDPGPFVWAISKSAMTLYRVTNTSAPAVTGSVTFGSPPVALAVDAHSAWVATEDGNVTQIRF